MRMHSYTAEFRLRAWHVYMRQVHDAVLYVACRLEMLQLERTPQPSQRRKASSSHFACRLNGNPSVIVAFTPLSGTDRCHQAAKQSRRPQASNSTQPSRTAKPVVSKIHPEICILSHPQKTEEECSRLTNPILVFLTLLNLIIAFPFVPFTIKLTSIFPCT